MKTLALSALLTSTLAACTADVEIITEDQGATSGASITTERSLSGCHGQASSSIPSNDQYVITTFGGGSDTQPMSCGGLANGTGYYAASRQRYGCGSHIKVQANGKCVVLATNDYGPDVCVENAAHMPIIDVSPAASKILFGVSGAGWSDHLVVTVTEVSTSVALGPCQADTSGDGGTSGGGTSEDPPSSAASCASATLDRDVEDGVCVRSASDGAWYQCEDGSWASRSSSSGCAEAYGYCNSATLGRNVPARTCVQAASNGVWYQCNGQNWVTPVSASAGSGPIGDCSDMYAL